MPTARHEELPVLPDPHTHAYGLILPAALDIAPILVPLAAAGVILLMVGAIITHSRRHQPVGVALNLIYLGMAAFVACGRFGPESF